MRLLEKEAVSRGGGFNHRIGLYDAVLIKENHIAVAGGISKAVEACRQARPGFMIEVEAETAGQVEEAIASGADRILLDNMTVEQMAAAVAARDKAGARPELEASGGIDLSNVRAAAGTGVDFISIGSLTHSAPVLDFSMLVEPA
jgi:nicotinate-nucleotide pyrophosphorylase (carboxylating)